MREMSLRRALSVAIVAACAASACDRAPRREAPARPAPSGVPHPERCETLRRDYERARDAAAVCERDADCTLEPRGLLHTGLDGCFRAQSWRGDVARADRIAAAWLGFGCASSYALCPMMVASSACREGRCRVIPPAHVPESWRRVDIAAALSLFLPPEIVEVTPSVTCGDAPYTRIFRGDEGAVRVEVGDDVGYLPPLVPPAGEILPERVFLRRDERVGAHLATRIAYWSPLLGSKATTRDGSWPRYELRRALVIRDVAAPSTERPFSRDRGPVAVHVVVDGDALGEHDLGRVLDSLVVW